MVPAPAWDTTARQCGSTAAWGRNGAVVTMRLTRQRTQPSITARNTSGAWFMIVPRVRYTVSGCGRADKSSWTGLFGSISPGEGRNGWIAVHGYGSVPRSPGGQMSRYGAAKTPGIGSGRPASETADPIAAAK